MDCASVLFEAAGGGNPDSLSLLLEYGADANVPKHSGHLPIHRAAYRGHFLWVNMLKNQVMMTPEILILLILPYSKQAANL